MIWLWAGAAWGASLSGTVTDDAGAPLSGIYVAVYDEAFEQVSVDGPTAADGAWRVEVPAGRMRVRAVPDMAVNRVESWAPGEIRDACFAEVYELFDQSREAGVVVRLAPGLGVGGELRDARGEPVSGAVVTALPIGGGSSIQPRQALSDAQGRFEVRGLPSDRAWNLDVDAAGIPDQFYPGGYSRLAAPSYDGGPGEVADAGVATLLPGITLGGLLTGPGGPIAGAVVSAYSPNQIESARTDAAGRYEIVGLPPGEVTAWSTPEGHAKTYFPDSDRPGERVSVPDDGDVFEDLDIDAPLEARVDGRLLGDGDLSDAWVLLYNDAFTVGFGSGVDVDGRFSIGALHGGDWLLQTDASLLGYVPGLVGGEDDPTRFTVPDEGVVEIEVELVEAAEIDGTVRRADGEPAYDALVIATSRRTGVRYRTRTGRDGVYRLYGLPGDDTWDLSAEGDPPCPDDPTRVRFHFPNTPDPDARVGVALRAGEVLTWDVQLPDDLDHDGMDDEWEARWGLDPSRPDGLLDPDGDGNVNLIEYWNDEDPLSAPGGCGCAATGGGGAGWLLLPLLGIAARRRDRRRRR